jgi:hypothetical protein
MRAGLIAVVAAAALIAAAPAQAAKGTYAGTVTNTTGKIALDVKIQQGVVTKVTHLRGEGIPSTCEISGPIPAVDFDLASSLTVKSNGKFHGTYTQPTYGNESTISGRIKHKHVAGTIRVNYHYQADPQHGYPEENCDTGPLPFTAKLGAPDATVTTSAGKRLGR